MDNLFSHQAKNFAPLAEQMRPVSLSDMVGQKALLAENAPLRRILEQDRLVSMIFWGPPGVGKTTLARVIAHDTNSEFVAFSATMNGVAEIREAAQKAKSRLELQQRRTI
ncbi:MAG TPA: AAA family ATPase, partial [Candidatus Gracilibacteria bacterium]|nr:AAA family ATPase [Candidatus Gracilibacteria bacterium]